MRAARRARQGLTRRQRQFTVCLNCAATLLAFGTRAAAIAAAFAPISSASAAPPSAPLATVLAFAAWLAAILTTGRGLAAFGRRALLVARAPVIAAISALTAATPTTSTSAAVSAVALIRLTPAVAARRAALGGRWGLICLAAKYPFQPADKAAGLFLGLDVRRTILNWLILSRLELAAVTAGLAWFIPAWLTRIALAAFAW